LRQGSTEYLLQRHLPALDIYFTFTGGPALEELETTFGVPLAVPLYCSVDPERHHPLPSNPHFACDLSYMGTYAADRQPKIEKMLCVPARSLPQKGFIVAGPQYPESMEWPTNVRRIMHLEPKYHAALYSSSRLTLNVTRRDMVMAGYSPSVRLFEAAACGAAIVSDNWPGLDGFFTSGREILLSGGSEDVLRYVSGYDDAELKTIGNAARERVLASHSNQTRALEFERAVEIASKNNARSSIGAV
jgi:spore maturation protein CgeB